MKHRVKAIEFLDARPMGMGRIVSISESTRARGGFLIAGSKGLYLASLTSDDTGLGRIKTRRMRKFPVGWLVSGPDSVILYEEADGQGRLVWLDAHLKEEINATDLARKISPRAVYRDGVIIVRRNRLEHLSLPGRQVTVLSEITPFRFLGPFARTNEGFEFIAVHKGEGWPTCLYRLVFGDGSIDAASLEKIATVDEPIMPSVFIPHSSGIYIVARQGQSRFETFRIKHRNEPELTPRDLFIIPGDVKPVAGFLEGDVFYTADSDTLIKFKIRRKLL